MSDWDDDFFDFDSDDTGKGETSTTLSLSFSSETTLSDSHASSTKGATGLEESWEDDFDLGEEPPVVHPLPQRKKMTVKAPPEKQKKATAPEKDSWDDDFGSDLPALGVKTGTVKQTEKRQPSPVRKTLIDVISSVSSETKKRRRSAGLPAIAGDISDSKSDAHSALFKTQVGKEEQKKIVGIRADRNQAKSNWDEDFDMGQNTVARKLGHTVSYSCLVVPGKPTPMAQPPKHVRGELSVCWGQALTKAMLHKSKTRGPSVLGSSESPFYSGDFGSSEELFLMSDAEIHDISEAKFLLSIVPQADPLVGCSDKSPIWVQLTPKKPFPDWLNKKDPKIAQSKTIRHALDMWNEALVMQKERPADSITAINRIFNLFDDIAALPPMFIGFLGLMCLHVASFADMIADVFEQSNALYRGLAFFNSPGVDDKLMEDPGRKDYNAVKAALCYETALYHIRSVEPDRLSKGSPGPFKEDSPGPGDMDAAGSIPLPGTGSLALALKYLRFSVAGDSYSSHTPMEEDGKSKKVRDSGGGYVWWNIFRGLLLVRRCLPDVADKLRAKFTKKIKEIADILGSEGKSEMEEAEREESLDKARRVIYESPSISGSAKSTDSDDDDDFDDDWDAEFGIEVDRQVLNIFDSNGGSGNVCSSLLSTTTGSTGTSIAIGDPTTMNSGTGLLGDGLPPQHQVVSKIIDSDGVSIDVVPPSLVFYSIKSSKGRKFLQSQDVGSWLSAMVQSKIDNKYLFYPRDKSTVRAEEKREIQNEFSQSVRNIETYGIEWFCRKVHYIRHLYSIGEEDAAWFTLVVLLTKDVIAAGSIAGRQSSKDPAAARSRLKILLEAASRALYVAKEMWTPERNDQYLAMLSTCEKILPSYGPLMNVWRWDVLVEGMMEEGLGIKDRLTKPGTEDIPNPFAELVGIFAYYSLDAERRKEKMAEGKKPSKGSVTAALAAALTIEIAESGYTPCSFEKISEGEWEDFLWDFDLSRCGEHIEREGTLKKTTKSHLEKLEKYKMNALSHEKRIEFIRNNYADISFSCIKSRAAFVLAKDCIEKGAWDTAESLLFEALFITDRQDSRSDSSFSYVYDYIPMTASGVCLHILELFGEVLVHNNKYKLAPSAFEAAISICKFLDRKEFYIFSQKIAKIAWDEDDDRSCFRRYTELVNKYNSEGRANEASYVHLIMSSLRLESGDFKEARDELDVVIKHLKSLSQEENPIDYVFWKTGRIEFEVYSTLVQVLLRSYDSDTGVKLLVEMSKHKLSGDIKKSVSFALASIYSKRGWLKDALENLESVVSSKSLVDTLMKSINPSYESKKDESKDEENSSEDLVQDATYFLDNLNEVVDPWFKIVLDAYSSAQMYGAMVKITDFGLATCNVMLLTKRGSLYFRRGYALESLFFRSSSFTYPTTLYDDVPELETLDPSFLHPTVFNCRTDIFQEAAACYVKAYNLFYTTGDDYSISCVMNALARLYLNHLFQPCAIGGSSIEKQGTMTRFTSPLCDECFKDSGFEPGSFTLSLKSISNPASLALDIAAGLCDIELLPSCLLNMAEVELISGNKDRSIAYWKECRDLVWGLYFDGTEFILKKAPVLFIESIHDTLIRLVRILLCFGKDNINNNLTILDALLTLEDEFQYAIKRPTEKYADLASFAQTAGKDTGMKEVKDTTPVVTAERTPRNSIDVVTPATPSMTATPSVTATSSLATETSSSTSEDDVKSDSSSKSDFTTSGLEGLFPEDLNTVKKACFVLASKEMSQKELAKNVWKALYVVRGNITKFSERKMTKEDVFKYNKKALDTALLFKCRDESLISSYTGAPKSPEPATRKNLFSYDFMFEKFSKKYVSLARKTVYVLCLKSVLAFYAPETGKVHFESLSYITTSENTLETLKPTHSETDSPKEVFLAKIHLYFSKGENVMALLSKDCTSDTLVDEICTMLNKSCANGEEEPVEVIPTISGIPSDIPPNPDGSTRLVYLFNPTEGFLRELNSFASRTNPESLDKSISSRLKSTQLTLAKGAPKDLTESQTRMVPLSRFVTPYIAECFTQRDVDCSGRLGANSGKYNYMNLYLCGNSSHESSLSYSIRSRFLSPDIVGILRSLICGLPNPVANKADQDSGVTGAISNMRVFFSGLTNVMDIMKPKATSRASRSASLSQSQRKLDPRVTFRTKKTGFGTIFKGKKKLEQKEDEATSELDKLLSDDSHSSKSNVPVILLCSLTMRAIPWEVLYPAQEFVRYLCLSSFCRSIVASTTDSGKQRRIPEVTSFVSQNMELLSDSTNNARTDYLCQQIRVRFCNAAEPQILSKDVANASFFRNPLPEVSKRSVIIPKKTFPTVNFISIDLPSSKLSALFSEILSIMNKDATAYPLICVSYPDTVEIPRILNRMMKFIPSCCVLGFPKTAMRISVKQLCDLLEEYQSDSEGDSTPKPQESAYTIISKIVSKIRQEICPSLIVFNPPAPVPLV